MPIVLVPPRGNPHRYPDLILRDVHLGDMDGRDLCQHVKNEAGLSHIPVVLIPSTLNAPAPKVLAAVRADAFINEPIEPAALAGMLRRVLNGDPS